MSAIKNLEFNQEPQDSPGSNPSLSGQEKKSLSGIQKSQTGQATSPTQSSTETQKPLQPKKSRFKFCCFSCIILLVLFILGLISAVAASGLMYIPGFSQVLYREPKPTRVVKEMQIENLDAYLQEKFQAEYEKKGSNNQLQTELREEELTALLKSQGSGNYTLSNLQVVILPEHLEFFGRVKSGVINTVFVFNLQPEVKDEKLYLRPLNLKIGALNLPIRWMFAVSNLEKYINQPLEISQDLKITNLQLEDGKIQILIYFKNLETNSALPESSKVYQSI